MISLKDKEKLKDNGLGWFLKPGVNGPVYKSITELRVKHGKRIFRDLFLMKNIEKKRKSHHFRYSFQTNGKGVQLSFGKWIEIPVKDIKQSEFDDATDQPKHAKIMSVTDMIPGREYSYRGKHLISFEQLSGWTIRSLDPGVINTYSGVDLLTGDNDIRSTKIVLTTKHWRFLCKTAHFTKQQKKWFDIELGEVQTKINE
jgi:hypothetical protein